jgi:hypothetical protein
VSGPAVVVEDDDDENARGQVLGDLAEGRGPAVVRGEDLDDQLGSNRQVAGRERAAADAIERVEGDVGASDGIGVALGDDGGVVRQDLAEIGGLDMEAEEEGGITADFAVAGLRGGVAITLPSTSSSGWPRSGRRANCSAVRAGKGVAAVNMEGASWGR